MLKSKLILCCGLAAAIIAPSSQADEIARLKSVGAGSKGTAEAQAARDKLVQGGEKNLIPLLKAFGGSPRLTTNWLRSTFEAIADAEIKSGRSLPKGDFLEFIHDTSQSPAARRLAYEWLLKRSPELEDELIPKMLLDPSPDFRRDAVARLIDEAGETDGETKTATLQKALKGAVHEDQVKKISKALRDAGAEVNIQQHFGFLPQWKIIGPFDNKEMKGYPVEYPPEQALDLAAEYDGQLGKVKWEPIATDDDYGVVNIAEDIENYKGSLMYATTVYQSGKNQDVQFRLGTPNAWKLWVNGKLIFEREEYHRSTRMDQYKIAVSLKAGANTILLKVCQNEQEQPWAQKYQFQLRVSDNSGAAVLPATTSAKVDPTKGQLR